MRITLIDTDSTWGWGSRMISSVLKSHGHHTRIVLMNSDKPGYSAVQLDAMESLAADSDLIGLSCHSKGSDKARVVLQRLKHLGILTVGAGFTPPSTRKNARNLRTWFVWARAKG